MKPSIRLLAIFVLLTSGLPLLTAAGNSDRARDDHQRIVDFWTPERVAQAVPRDFVLDPATGRVVPTPGKPGGTPGGGNGGGNGGGGGDSTVVSGESWNGGGEIDGASGKVLFAMDGSYWVCSATVIDDGDEGNPDSFAIILTAAHCVYDEANLAFATNWMFVPDYDAAPVPLDTGGTFCGSTAHGCWTAEAMAVHSGYAYAGSFGDALAYDFGLVRVGPGGHSGTAELDQVVQEQGFDFSGPGALDGSVDGHAFGYPAEKKWNGDDLIYCFGSIDGDPYNSEDTYRLNECKLNGGSSGGPWLAPFDESDGAGTVISVNSYGYRGVNAMHGPFLNRDTQLVYDAAQGSGGVVPGA